MRSTAGKHKMHGNAATQRVLSLSGVNHDWLKVRTQALGERWVGGLVGLVIVAWSLDGFYVHPA
jgi:hypothetical protein